MKVLITTFGFDENKVCSAMRDLPYQQLVVISGEENFKRKEFKFIEKLENFGNNKVKKVAVNVDDFYDCFDKANKTIEFFKKQNAEIKINISGGTKLLANAVLLSAFHNGIEVYHCEENTVKLPVLKDIAISELLTNEQKLVLKEIKNEISLEKLFKKRKFKNKNLNKILNELKELKLVEINENVKLSKSGEYFRER